MLKTALKAAAIVGAMLVPGVAAAASAAIVTADLNMRTGPGTNYRAFTTVPSGNRVTVFGCASGYNWCDIDWAGNRGWVSGNYLAYREGGAYYDEPYSTIGISIGIPIIGYDPWIYYDSYYRGRYWYGDRYRYHGGGRYDRWDAREDWRDDRRDWRDDRRDWRVEDRSVRRDGWESRSTSNRGDPLRRLPRTYEVR